MRSLYLYLLLASIPGAAFGQSQEIVIGYVEQAGDERYRESGLEYEFQGQPWGRPFVGAEVALDESRFPAMAVGMEFSLAQTRVDDLQGAIDSIRSMRERGIRLILTDLAAGIVAPLALETRDLGVVLFNVSAPDDVLRQHACQPHLFHILASHAMRNDALAQYLVSRRWRDVLLLTGPEKVDQQLAESWRRSADRYGLRIRDERHFVLGNDPRARELNNPLLLTSGVDYDVVYIADTYGEFAQLLPYGTQLPRPVVGSGGLVAQDWHWAWSSHGAQQLNSRFEAAAGRHGTAYDWAAWMAVKTIVESMLRTGSGNIEEAMTYIQSSNLVLDSFKGYRLGFRDWNRQLRQPILLGTGNWVVARAPVEGFLHQENYLDTLGYDQSESLCELQ